MSYKNNAISSDDPKAIEKLTEKLHKCEELQTLMKKANAHYKKYGTVKGCEGISDEKAENLDMSARSVHYHWEKQPFPSYHITNNGAEIRRIKKRIENLEANKNTEFVGWKFDGGEAVINEDKNRLQLLFDEKPSKEQRETLKANGFRWAPSDVAWQRQLNPNAFYAANRIDFIKPENGEKNYIDKETVSWLCIVAAAPIAIAGFFKYNGMNFEEFVGAWFRSEFLAAGVRKFESTNYLYEMIKEELTNGNAKSVRKKKPNKKAKKKNCKDGSAVDTD